MVEINIVSTAKDIEQAKKAFCLFSQTRLDKVQEISHENTFLLSCAAELAICLSLSKLSCSPAKGAYSYDEKGRPVCRNGFLSVSHSGELAICAISDFPIGVDIEKKRVFSGKIEKYLLNKEDYISKEFGLLGLWTVKEAFLKLTGDGIRFPMNKVKVFPDSTVSNEEITAQSISLHCEDEYLLSLCSLDMALAKGKIEIKKWSYSEATDYLVNNN